MSRILIVDDQEENRYFLEALLEGYRHEVISAANGQEALALARQDPPNLVVSDLLMPVMDGYTLLREWKSDPVLRRVPFVVYTATYTQPEDEQLALDLGADAFMVKPAEPEVFMARVAVLLSAVQQHPTVAPRPPIADDGAILTQYNQALIRKLEQKTVRLEEVNRALQADIAERERDERERVALLHALGQRIKELRALHEIGHLLADDPLPLPERLQRVANRLPEAMQYPEITVAAVCYGAERATTPGYERASARLVAAFTAASGLVGEVEVAYLAERPPAGEGPFLAEERQLLESLAGMLCAHVNRRDAHGALMASQRQQALILDSVDEGMHGLDLAGHITFANRAGCRLLCWPESELVGQDSHTVIHHHRPDGSPFPAELCPIYATLRDGETRRVSDEVFFRKDGSSFPVEYTCSPLRDEGGAIIGGVVAFRDISTRKVLEQQVLRVQRMDSIGTLAGGIAHDLNNVLSPIIIAVERLKDSVRAPADTDLVALIEASARRGASLVSQVLAFGRGVEGRRVELNPADAIRELRTILEETLPKNIRVVAPLDAGLWPVVADSTQLQQVLLNLCVNARDAMPHGGALTVTAENLQISDDEAALLLEAQAGHYVRITVEDTGTGIADSLLDQIFDPFFTTKEVGKGTGLGLATSQAIVRSHGGFIRVSSEVGVGSRFLVYLPARLAAAGPETAATETAAAGAELPRGHGELILVVDDEAAIRQITRQTLEAFGYRILLAADGAEAVATYREHQAEIDLLITDMMMPVMDGPATIRVLRRINPKVRVIAVSGLSAGPGGEPSHGESDIEFLAKPFTSRELLQAVHRALTHNGAGPG